ncbi:hypothetical protein [Citrobacter portucalensis]|uniref:hypothetical protein n=1 Tax=Citrobacter portucalensis TaxID=1639133 RepID=UPI0018A8DF4A|nr:hypothetical protein [Citrobacter portucalensis]MCC2943065.1 hypothetical protein [Citrobacter freundii]UKK87434.1 hypothetical protein L6310_17890 [Citrobacter portucalensis]
MTRTDIENYQKASVLRADPECSWMKLASVPRRSYLGKYRRLTPSQSRWVRSLLGMWGREFGGSGTEHLTDGAGILGVLTYRLNKREQMKRTKILQDILNKTDSSNPSATAKVLADLGQKAPKEI